MSTKLEQAISAVKAGDKVTGQQLLAELLKADPRDENAWLWLTQTVDSDEERLRYLRKVLRINPDNKMARRGLTKLQQEQASQARPPAKPERSNRLSVEAVLQQINAARMQGLTPDLNGANLSQLDLSGADLSDASFREVNLSQANLNQASLRHANLSGANLSGANLSQANLNGGHLAGADLSGANLSSANLNGGNLVRANLGEANLTGADLRWANLSQANLGQADLSGANLEEAILKGTDLHNVRHNPQTKWPVLFTPPTPQQPLVKPTVDPRSEGISIVPSQEREVEPEPVSPGHILLPLSEPELPVSHSWLEAWVKALMRPSLKTFEELANDPKASSSRAFKWIFVSALIISLPTWILSGGSLLGAGIGAVLGAALFITIINVIALLLGGKGTYGQLTFTMAAFMVPLALISIVVQVIANLNSSLGFVVWLLFGLYWLVLAVIAVKAVHQFGWLKAVTTNSLIPVVITGLLVATVVFTQPAGAVGDDFMGALQNSNYAQAYSLCTPDLQSELDSSENLEVILSQVDVQIASWDWSLDRRIEGNEARLSGKATLASGQTGTVALYLVRTNGAWRVNGFDFQPD